MGEEAPEIVLDSLNEILPPVHAPKSWSSQSSTVVGDKTFVVEGSDDGAKSCLSVKVFVHSTASWSIPAVLGAKPVQTNGHSASLLSNDRIAIIKRDALLDDCIWFLEIDTPFVREKKKILGTEVVAWSKGVLGFAPKPVVISGPSGVGKGTLIAKLMKEFPSKYGFSVSHTTRAPREKEINGIHYHFTERSIMEQDIKDGKFLEFASVHGNLYGTSIEAVEVVADSGKKCILDIDVQGARSVRASPLKAIFIFIAPPSFYELEKRLRARGTETEEQVQKRLRNAKAELDQANSGLFDHVLINDDLEACYENLKKLLSPDETMDASFQQSMKNVKIPVCHIVSGKDQKIHLHCRVNDLNGSKPSLFLLDASSLNGGAPGRTRGLNAFGVNSIEDEMNRIEQL